MAAHPTYPATREAPWRWPRTVLRGCLLGLCLAFAAEAGRVLFGRNFHAVIPGQVYRCAQMSKETLEQVLPRHGIRTVVNLRGLSDPYPWYLDECRATHHSDVAQEDICLSAGRLPPVAEMRHLVEVLDRTEYPILIHCKRGSDRTGVVAAVVLLLRTDTDLATARRQLGLRYGHLPLGRPAYLDQFFDLYAGWLRQQGLAHSAADFRRWLEHAYCPAACWCSLELLDLPPSLPRGEPAVLHLRARNTSIKPWRFRPGGNAGIHACFFLWGAEGNCLIQGRAGLFDAEVAPGRSIDLDLALPAVTVPGRYRLLVDMVEEQHCQFFQTGSEPLETELEIR